MKNFTDNLERELLIIAPTTATPRVARWRTSRGRWPAVGAAAAGAVALLVLLTLALQSNGPARAAELPVLQRPGVDATPLQNRLPRLNDAGVDFRSARRIKTPTGQGFVMISDSSVCLAIPDPPAGYGQTCSTRADADRRGLWGQLVSPSQSHGPSTLVIVMPSHATQPVARFADGHTAKLTEDAGTATAQFRSDAAVSYVANGTRVTIDVHGVEPQGRWSVDCGDGRVIYVPSQRDTFGAARERRCRG